MGATRQGCGEFRFEQRSFGDPHVDQIVETVVEQYLRIEHHDHVDAEEHLEHVLVQVEIDRSLALRVGAGEVEHHLLALAPHGAFDLVRAIADAVVADIILETDRFLTDRHGNQLLHRAMVACQQFLRGGDIDIVAEPLGHLHHAACRNPAGGDQRVEIGLAPVGLARLMHDELHQILVIFALFPDFDRRDAHAFLEDRARRDRHRSDNAATDVALMPEHRGIGDQPPVLEHRQQHQPVVGMRNRPLDRIGIGEEDHVPIFQRALIAVEEATDEAAELADDHPSLMVGDQRKGIALFADAG